MKKLLFTAAAFFVAMSASAQFLLTPSGMVSSEDPQKNYAVISIPGKTQQEIFEAVKLYANSAFGYNGCKVEVVEDHLVSVWVAYTSQNDNTLVLKGTGYDMTWNANMLGYNIVYRIKDGKLRMDAPKINAFTMVIRGISYPGYLNHYPSVDKKRAIFGRNGRVLRHKRQIAKGIEEYFNKMLNEPVLMLAEQW